MSGEISDFQRKIMILLIFREQQIWPTGAISGGFETSKSPGVLRCAQCSLFRRRHVQHQRMVIFMVTVVGCELIELPEPAFHINMACRDGLCNILYIDMHMYIYVVTYVYIYVYLCFGRV